MPPPLALGLFVVYVVIVYSLDFFVGRSRRHLSIIPTVWVLIIGARPPSAWLRPGTMVNVNEGSLEERTIFSLLIVSTALLLVGRWGRISARYRLNPWLSLFLAYAAVSILWSELPFVALKRFVKFIGLTLAAAVIVSEESPAEAMKALFRRSAYFLIPCSVLLVKYYPHLGVQFSEWTGAPELVGVAESKNMLGQLCLVLGLGLAWVLCSRSSDVDSQRGRQLRRLVDLGVLGLALHILYLSDSKTSLVCMAVGVAMLGMLTTRVGRRRLSPILFTALIVVVVGEVMFGLSGSAAAALGRDPTLTNRTLIWQELWAMRANVWIGAGYDSFWLGERLAAIQAVRHINEAHNGYLEILLNLGVVGLALSVCVLTRCYLHAKRVCQTEKELGAILVTMLVVVVVYNWSESGFKGLGLINLIFVLTALERRGATVLPKTGLQATQQAVPRRSTLAARRR